MTPRQKPEPLPALPPLPGPWVYSAKQPDALIEPDGMPGRVEEADWYGGAFICESVSGPHRDLLSAVPEMLAALEIAEDLQDLVTDRIRHSDPRVLRWGDPKANLGWIGAVKLLRDRHHELRRVALAKAKGYPPPTGFVAS